MKIMVASDIHGDTFWCDKMLSAFDKEKADKLLLLGDILYHGPRNDLPANYAPKEVISLLNARKNDIMCVRGNCDTEVDQMVLEFPIMADYCILPIEERIIYATHGHRYNLETPMPMQSGDILLHGHTHVPAWISFGNHNLYLNPGSVSIPKENTKHSYMIMEGREISWKDMEGNTYHTLKV